ncbi:MAG: C-terminal target protein [Flavipsychrobacter sp.]|nr:C-terminal target protein [Flavipsychrobacter sp.]
MKKILLSLFTVLAAFSSGMLYAQTFSFASDTVHAVYTGPGLQAIHDDVTATSGTVNVKYHILNTDFPASWLASAALGMCDAGLCRNNLGDTFLWNNATTTGKSFNCNYTGTDVFDMSLDLSAAVYGCHWIKVEMTDNALPTSTKIATFIVCKNAPSALQNVAGSDAEIKLYPNPARDEINVVYDASIGVKSIAIYNIIGKVVNVYKVPESSANLNIESIPSGIYFVKLYNGNGNVVMTKKFTKQ